MTQTTQDQTTPPEDGVVGLIGSPGALEAAAAARSLLADADDGWVSLGALTDEELVVFNDSPEAANPAAQWYTELDLDGQQIAQKAALRSLVARGRLVFAKPEDGGAPEIILGQDILGMLQLRSEADPVLTATRVTADEMGWAVYRWLGDLWLRELVTEQGYHQITILEPGTVEGPTFLAWCGGDVETSKAADVDRTLSRAQLEDAQKDLLATCSAVTTLVRLNPEGGDVEGTARVININTDGSVLVGDPKGEHSIRYHGLSAADLATDFDSWRTMWERS